MNYEQKYKEALERAKRLYEQGTITESLSHVFPELAESEDEKIRKDLMWAISRDWLLDGNTIKGSKFTKKDMLAWLEKQGEPTDINPSEFDSRLNKLLKQFEALPKEELESILAFYLNVVQNNGTYKEEKQGEEKPAIEMISAEESLGISSEEWNKIVDECVYGEPFGASDSELQEATYYIPKGFHAEIEEDKVVIKKGEYKPAWSEEDEVRRQQAINALDRNGYYVLVNWLKSLRPQK